MNLPEGWHQESRHVFRSRVSPLALGDAEIQFLRAQVPHSPLRRVRLCTHWNDDETLHEMLIAMDQASYVRPHRHSTKTESFHMIEGEMDVVIFSDEGEIDHVIPLGRCGKRRNFYYRLSSPRFHSLVIRSNDVVFQEITTGPFRKGETIYARWAPEDSDPSAVLAFQQNLRGQAAAWHMAAT
jgi:cupin fold WbuC family metalloprotein